MRRLHLAGAVTVVGYLAAVVVLQRLGPVGVRPLYDGFVPPPPYRWVNPPVELKSTNKKPESGKGTVANGNDPFASIAFQTPDFQAGATIDLASLHLAKTETSADATLTPVDPATLGPLPAGIGASGNAYRLVVVAQPDGRAVTAFTPHGTLLLEYVTTVAETMYYSADGKAWTKLASQLSTPDVVASIGGTGWYVLGGPTDKLPKIGRPSSRTSPWPVAIASAIALLTVAGVILLVRRRRS